MMRYNHPFLDNHFPAGIGTIFIGEEEYHVVNITTFTDGKQILDLVNKKTSEDIEMTYKRNDNYG